MAVRETDKWIDFMANSGVSPVTGRVIGFPFPILGVGENNRTGHRFIVRRLQVDVEFWYDEVLGKGPFRVLRVILFRDNQHRGTSFGAGFMTHVEDGVLDPWDLTVNPLNWVYSLPKLCNECRHDILLDEMICLLPKTGTSAGHRYTRLAWSCNVWDNTTIHHTGDVYESYNGPWYGLAVTSDVSLLGINMEGKMRLRFDDS